MRPRLADRDVRFTVEDGCLVRTVMVTSGDTSGGGGYTQRCERKVFEMVAHAIQETPPEGKGTTLAIISRQECLPFSQVNVALEFLKERGIVVVRHRRCYPGIGCTYLDAMIEFLALQDGESPTD